MKVGGKIVILVENGLNSTRSNQHGNYIMLHKSGELSDLPRNNEIVMLNTVS